MVNLEGKTRERRREEDEDVWLLVIGVTEVV